MSEEIVLEDDLIEQVLENGDRLFFKVQLVGGIDKNGKYSLVLDGPAQGEKVYE